MSKLTAQDIRLMLIDLDIAEKHRDLPKIHEKCINAVRQALLRAALTDVEIEPLKEAA